MKMFLPESLPPRLSVQLVGGPAHGQTLLVRMDRKRIEVPYAAETSDASDIEVPHDGVRPKPVEVSAVMLVYLRANEDATTAEYHDLEIE